MKSEKIHCKKWLFLFNYFQLSSVCKICYSFGSQIFDSFLKINEKYIYKLKQSNIIEKNE